MAYGSNGAIADSTRAPGSALGGSPATDLGGLLQLALEHHRAGRSEACEACCEQALALQPGSVDALHLRGMAAKLRGDLSAALDWVQRAIDASPGMPGRSSLYSNFGNILRAQGCFDAALTAFAQALALDPDNVDALSNQGDTLRLQGRLGPAEQVLQRASTLAPSRADVRNNLAAVQQQGGRTAAAAQSYLRALELDPTLAVAHYNLACILGDAGELAQAAAHHEQALASQPAYLDAAALRLRLAQMMCDWEAVRRWQARSLALGAQLDLPIPPFMFVSLEATGAQQRENARRWVRTQLAPFTRVALPPREDAAGEPARRLRLGYLSGDFHDHATAFLMAEVFELHERGHFEVFGYSSGPDDGGSMRPRLRAAFDHFVDIQALSPEDAARCIRADGIDILVDLKGYTRGSRSAVLALRPAPIQVNYLGYPGSMGASFVDYVLTDPVITPANEAAEFDEQLAYLPDSYQCNDRQRPIGERPSREACGLPAEALVWCCFNHTYKITEPVFALWCRLLQAVPESVLWLLKSNAWAEENLRAAARERGLDAQRLVFAVEQPLALHLGRLQNADIFLDTLPYNAHTTASDALWAGVPVVHRAGVTFASRVAGSLLRAVGLAELITTGEQEYVDLALRLARDPGYRRELRARLADAREHAPLFDTPRFTRNLERIFTEMWRRHRVGEAPSTLRLRTDTMDTATPASVTRELLIGCGQNHAKKLVVGGRKDWGRLTTLDINPDHRPDVVWDLTQLPLPFEGDSFDEIHAYEVLEHTGRQGDYAFFFAQFAELWRILKPNGMLIGTCPLPSSVWAWGDPSHTRVVQKEQFIFLDQSQYTRQVGHTAMSDFRYIYRADFHTEFALERDDLLQFVLRAVKPSRITAATRPA